MKLIKLIEAGKYIGIDNAFRYNRLRKDLIKKLMYLSLQNSVLIIKRKNTTIYLNYTYVEDPNNLGNSFSSLDALWNWLLNSINTS